MKPRVDELGSALRFAGPQALAEALRASRRDTLQAFAGWRAALGDTLRLPQQPTLNPPLWELGHIGWFQEYWIGRNPQRGRGAAADPDVARHAARRADADALYDSGRVAHATRWALPLPGPDATLAELEAQLAQTLALLLEAPADDAGLYFFRLALLHEDMHQEAACYMAQAQGIELGAGPLAPPPTADPADAPGEIALPAGRVRLGSADAGFAFDNELPAHECAVEAFRIDRRVRCWAEVLPFVEAGGYAQPRWWSTAGRAWLAQTAATQPRGLRRAHGVWQQRLGPRWESLDPARPACHLNLFEAEAWCAWAGRRLPSEAEWAHAARHAPDTFDWGQVWEWTASPFAGFAGFVAHPYRDYSAPWFGSRQVLRGAAFATSPRLRHAAYRNFFTPERNDIFAGLRSCAP